MVENLGFMASLEWCGERPPSPTPRPPSSPALRERKGAEGKVRGPGVLRSIGAEPDATCFYRAKATYAFPTNVSLWSLSKARIVDEALRYSPLQPTTLLSA